MHILPHAAPAAIVGSRIVEERRRRGYVAGLLACEARVEGGLTYHSATARGREAVTGESRARGDGDGA